MPERITILSPADLKPGTVAPDGRTVTRATMYVTSREVVVTVEFDNLTSTSFMWPNGSGWTVDGRAAS